MDSSVLAILDAMAILIRLVFATAENCARIYAAE